MLLNDRHWNHNVLKLFTKRLLNSCPLVLFTGGAENTIFVISSYHHIRKLTLYFTHIPESRHNFSLLTSLAQLLSRSGALLSCLPRPQNGRSTHPITRLPRPGLLAPIQTPDFHTLPTTPFPTSPTYRGP